MKVSFVWAVRRRWYGILLPGILLIAIFVCFTWGGKKLSNQRLQQTCLDFLDQYGWEVDAASEHISEIQIPHTFSQFYQEFNQLEKEQGFDLEEYQGEICQRICYRASGENEGKEVELYLYKGEIIGAQVHGRKWGDAMEKVVQ